MEFIKRPRHQIRAQGRQGRRSTRAEANLGAAAAVSLKSAKQTPAEIELLEFLSQAAATSEKELLEGAVLPGFERSARTASATKSLNFDGEIQTIERLNELMSKTRSLSWSDGDTGEFAAFQTESEFLESTSSTAFGGALKDLNDWLLAKHALAEEEDRAERAAAASSGESLRAISKAYRTDFLSSPANFSLNTPNFTNSLFGVNSAAQTNRLQISDHSGKVSMFMRPLFRQKSKRSFATRILTNGRRFESYDTGAVLEKDEFGRVTQIRSLSGASISIYYDRDGNPEGFVRIDEKGKTHSIAECDKQGVVVRDEHGRPRAQGDSLSVDQRGCLSICRSDGQFWSVDLVHGRHIERRRLSDETGAWHVLTGIFAADGFRMVTLFQKVIEAPRTAGAGVITIEAANRWWTNAPLAIGSFRFYGRDGSVIEFISEDALTNLQPTQVWSPGTRQIDAVWKGRHQAGTAWDSVQEYVSSYLSR